MNHKTSSTVQPIKKGSLYLFQDEEILTVMEGYHVNKPTMAAQSNEELKEIEKWLEEAKRSEMNSITDSPTTNFEVESTYGTCSGTPGPDGFRSKLIDNANRESMTKCLLVLWSQGVFLKEWKKEYRAVLPKPNKMTTISAIHIVLCH